MKAVYEQALATQRLQELQSTHLLLIQVLQATLEGVLLAGGRTEQLGEKWLADVRQGALAQLQLEGESAHSQNAKAAELIVDMFDRVVASTLSKNRAKKPPN